MALLTTPKETVQRVEILKLFVVYAQRKWWVCTDRRATHTQARRDPEPPRSQSYVPYHKSNSAVDMMFKMFVT